MGVKMKNFKQFIKETFVPGTYSDGDNHYSINKLVQTVSKRKPDDTPIHQVISNNSDLGTKEGNFADNLKKPSDSFKERTMKADTQYPVMLHPDGWIIDGSHRVAKQHWAGAKTIKTHTLSHDDLENAKIKDPDELKKSRDF